MELRLKFRRKEITDLYQESYETWEKNWTTDLRTKKLLKAILLCFTLVSFMLAIVHFDWIFYGFIFLIITVVYNFNLTQQKRKKDEEITKWKDEVDSFLRNYENIDGIKYIYDNEKIHYFEQDKLKVEILWDNIINIESNEKWIYVHLKDPKQNIWIPRVTVDKEELELFEQTIESRLQNRR